MNIDTTKNLNSFMWYFLKPYKIIVIFFIFLSFMTGLWSLNNLLIKNMIDTLILSNSTNVNLSIFFTAFLFVFNFEMHNIFWRLLGYLMYKFQPIIKNQIINETFKYVCGHSLQFFQNNLSGKISSQINILADNVEKIIDISRHIFRMIILLLISFISMYLVHPFFCIVLAFWFMFFSFMSIKVSKKLIELSESYADSESVVSGQLVDMITNNNNIKTFANIDYEENYLNIFLNFMKEAFQKKELFLIKLHFVQGLSISALLGFMLYLLIKFQKIQIVSVGDFALILGLTIEVAYMTWWAVEQFDEMNKSIGKCNQSLSKIFTEIEIKDQENAKDLIVKKGQIVFSNVNFQYKNSNLLFKSLCLTINEGQKIGLVGYSGGGKTTLINLILRFYDINNGNILIDSQSIYEVTQESLRKSISVISQDPSLFCRTLMENIRYGKINSTDQEVIAASKLAHAHDFIDQLPLKYESLVGERGLKLSGGQRQRIAMARAILKDSKILILDEATSQLDSITENYIQKSLYDIIKNKTTIVIAHRLSTLLNMDRILVFDKGNIVEDGSHNELLNFNGLYKKLWSTQVDGFIQDFKQ